LRRKTWQKFTHRLDGGSEHLTSEPSVNFYQATGRNIPEESYLQTFKALQQSLRDEPLAVFMSRFQYVLGNKLLQK
jgi:hypothetical protein